MEIFSDEAAVARASVAKAISDKGHLRLNIFYKSMMKRIN